MSINDFARETREVPTCNKTNRQQQVSVIAATYAFYCNERFDLKLSVTQ